MRTVATYSFVGILLWLGIVASAQPATAQDVQRIAAIVNDDVISGYDLERRLDLVIRTTRMEDSVATRRQIRGRVLALLIDEKLQLQAADTHNIRVSEKDLSMAINRIERQNNVRPGAFDEFLHSIGVDRDSLMTQIRADLAWQRVLRRRLQPIPEDEIEESLQRLQADVGKPEYRMSEIFLPVDTPDQVDEARRVATNLLAQINAGAPFSEMARQFSRGATASSGGQVGWTRADQLANEIVEIISALEPGAISEPIETQAGIYLIQLHDRRQFMMAAKADTKIALRQLLLTLPDEPSKAAVKLRTDEARALAGAIDSCQGIEAAAAQTEDVEYVDLGRLDLGQLSPQIRGAVQNLAVGDISQPLTIPGGIMLLMVCEREDAQIAAPGREQVIRELTRQKLAKIAQRYIRDLRRDALVEYR